MALKIEYCEKETLVGDCYSWALHLQWRRVHR